VKRAALSKAPRPARKAFNALIAQSERARVKGGRGFLHPGGYVGAGELTLMGERLAQGVQPQFAANESLITVRDRGWRLGFLGRSRLTSGIRCASHRSSAATAGLDAAC